MLRPPFPERPAGADEVVLDIDDIHALCLRMLDAFTAFCDRHGLSFYLCGGTLLGAVRHGGFIPWDDDLDLFMSRPDYDRLVQLCGKKEIAPGLRFACLENGEFLRPFARIYDLSAPVQRKTRVAASGPYVWIDILPVDGLPEDPRRLKALYRRRDRLSRWNYGAFWKPFTGSRKKMILKSFRGWVPGRLGGARRWAKTLDALGRRFPFGATTLVGCVTAGRYGVGEAMPLTRYLEPVPMTFEGRPLQTMSCWREYLTGIFGDYMRLPPEEERFPHLNYATMKIRDREALLERYGGQVHGRRDAEP